MKKTIFTLLILSITLVLYKYCLQQCEKEQMPEPKERTFVKSDMEDGNKGEARKAWFELLHQSSPDVDWQQIETKNMLSMSKTRKERRESLSRSGEEEIADGFVIGTWDERGSNNQAGSVIATEYDPIEEKIYTISAGGNMWMGNRIGSGWQVVNQDLRFGGNQLHVIPTSIGKRIIAEIKGIPYYSDDDGLNFTASKGMQTNNSNANLRYSTITVSGHILCLQKSGYWNDLKVYLSKDDGENFSEVKNFFTSDVRNIDMQKLGQTGEIVWIEQLSEDRSRIHLWDDSQLMVVAVNQSSPIGFGNDGRANVHGTVLSDTMHLYSYLDNLDFMMSVDTGQTWNRLSTLPSKPWGVGVYILPSDPSKMFYGEVNSYRSNNGGKNWTLVNEWWEYYDNVNAKLHADIMFVKEFQPTIGPPFMLISNHGGLSESLDGGKTNNNISLFGLNVSQYYDVRSYPGNPQWIFAGAQDQGFQRSYLNDEGAEDFTQVISGDYGHIEFTGNGEHLWTVYPGGWVSYYPSPLTSGHQAGWTVESDNESVWIPPLMPEPNANKDIMFLAGGNAEGGPGSHIIKLEATFSGIEVSQLPFDFINYGGEISAMAVSPFDINTWFVALTNGRIFKSEDRGISFLPKINNAPGSHYLYGSCILPSHVNSNIIYVSGSGYSTAPVVVSYDGGETFQDMSAGMPSTTAFNIVANEDETLLFAATEAGPYVYVKSEARWFDMFGVSAPNTTYWSVEYIEEIQTARFGTYGRGVWDFKLSPPSAIQDLATYKEQLHIYPNPASSYLELTVPNVGSTAAIIRMISIQGIEILNKKIYLEDGKTRLDVTSFERGNYMLSVQVDNRLFNSLLIKI